MALCWETALAAAAAPGDAIDSVDLVKEKEPWTRGAFSCVF